MRIAIVAFSLRVAGGLSVGQNVIAALRRVADEHDYLLLMPAGVGYEELEQPTRCTRHYYRRKFGDVGQAAFDQFVVPRLVRRFGAERVWSLGNFGLTRSSCPQAILYHQPHLLYDPAEQPRPVWRLNGKLRYVRWRLKRSLPATRLVFCQTHTAASRFRRMFGYQGTIGIMPNAVSRFALPERTPETPPELARLSGKFVLFCLTRYYRHKNLESLVELFERHREALRDVVILLTIRPDDHPQAARLLERIAAPPLAEHVINVGPLAQSRLAAFFLHVDGLILPTLLESFSGTYLEAMQFGCPILTSDMDFAREVCGDAALYFDPWNVDSMKDAILRLKEDARLRRELVDRGRQRVQGMFRSWDDIVRDAMRALLALT